MRGGYGELCILCMVGSDKNIKVGILIEIKIDLVFMKKRSHNKIVSLML